MPSVSVVLPALNEAPNLRIGIPQAVAALDAVCEQWELIVVDDGSQDETAEVVAAAHARDGRIRLIRHTTNQGYGAALSSGFRAARMGAVFFTDADLQFDLREIERLLPLLQDCDVVVGYRAVRQDPWNRRLNAWAWGQLVGHLFDLGVRDINCAFKLFRRSVLDSMDIRSGGAFVNTEVLAKARSAGARIQEVPVSHHPRRLGTQTGAQPRVVARAFLELASLYGEVSPRAARVEQRVRAVLAR